MDSTAARAASKAPVLGMIHGVDPRTGIMPAPHEPSPTAAEAESVFGSPSKLKLDSKGSQIWQQSSAESHGALTAVPMVRSVPRASHSHPLPPNDKASLAHDTPRNWVRERDPVAHHKMRRSYGKTFERLRDSPTRSLRPPTSGEKGSPYRIPRPGASRPIIPPERPPPQQLVIATYNSVSGGSPYVCGRGKWGTFPPTLTPSE